MSDEEDSKRPTQTPKAGETWGKKMSILSRVPDGMGYHYGFRDDDCRQINVRWSGPGKAWDIYVGGEWIGTARTKERAEKLALEWMDENPIKEDHTG